MIFVDTDVLVDVLRGAAAAREWLTATDEPVTVCGVSAMALIEGCRDLRDVRAVDALLAPLPILWPSPTGCGLAAQLHRQLKLSVGIGLLDALIAACVIENGATLATFNLRHFRDVPGLITTRPYAR